MMPSLIGLRAHALTLAADPAVKRWLAEHRVDTHPPCDRCATTDALTLRTCDLCTFALCPRCYLSHVVQRQSEQRDSLCTAVHEWAEMHAAFRDDAHSEDGAELSAEDFAAARDALRGYLGC